MQQHEKICGFYKLEAIKVKDGKEVSKRVVADWFPNLITNQGLDRLAEYNTILTYCSVGTGNTAPAFTDSTLVTKVAHVFLAITSLTSGYETSTPYYNWFKGTYRFAEGAAAGNLAEVGMGWTDTLLFSRALILDGGGSPTTITILSDEILDVYYEYRIYPKETDVTGTTVFTGNIGGTYDWTFRLANADDASPQDNVGRRLPHSMNYASYFAPYYPAVFNGSIGAITDPPSGTRLALTSGAVTFAAYTPGSYSITGTLALTVSQGNFTPAGITVFHFPVGSRMYQIEFDPAIEKTSSDVVSVTFTISWGRL